MALHLEVRFRVLFHKASHGVKRAVAALEELGRIQLELDSLLEFVEVFPLVARATHGVNGHALQGIRALVLHVGYAVTVKVRQAANAIDLRTGVGRGALVLHVGHAVAVAILRATGAVHFGAFQGTRALVERIGNAILVGILRAAEAIDFQALRGVRALVLHVGHAVAVKVKRATVGIHGDAVRGVRALVQAIGHAVQVVIVTERSRLYTLRGIDHVNDHGIFLAQAIEALRGFTLLGRVSLAKADGEHRGTGTKRSGRIAVVSHLAVRALVVDRHIAAAFHFLLVLEAEVLERTHGNIHTHREVDTVRNVETETRGQQHRVGKRGVAQVTNPLQADFAAEVDKEVHKAERDEVQARAIR